MKLTIQSLLVFFFCNTLLAQTTILSENMGTPSSTTSISTHTFQNSGSLSYSNGGQTLSADVRATSVSSNYSGASGAGNVFFTATSGTYGFSVEGINAANHHTLTLQFGYKKEAAASHAQFSVDYWNGVTWTTLANSAADLFNQAANASAVWYLSKTLSLPNDAQINGLKIRFVKSGTTSIRIDDIKLSGIETLPTVINNAPTNITPTSITFNGEVTNTAGSTIIETGNIFGGELVEDLFIGGSGVTKLMTSNPNSGVGTFSNNTAANLEPSTMYVYNAYAIKSNGSVSYGTPSLIFTLATTPLAPLVGSPTATSLNVSVSSDFNNPFTLYAIKETSTGNYVQADGSLGLAAVFNARTVWGSKTVIGLAPSTTYTFEVVARNGNGVLTSAGGETSGTTLAMPEIITSGSLTALATTYGTASAVNSFSFSASGLSQNVLITAPSGFEISVTSGGASGYADTQIVSPISGNIGLTTVYIRLASTTPFGLYGGNVILSSNSNSYNVNVAMPSSTVSKKALNITGISIQNKPYDGNTTAVILGYPILNGVVSEDENDIILSIDTVTANFVDATIGVGKSVTVSGYGISGVSSENYQLAQPSGLTANITNSAGSDFVMNDESSTNSHTNIDYRAYQGTQLSNTGNGTNGSLGIMGFYLRDGGEEGDADELSTQLTSLSFQIINPNAIRAARLFVGNAPKSDVVMVNGQSEITFSNLNIPVLDDDEVAINLRVTFNSVVTDNEQFIFTISGAEVNPAFSLLAAPNGGGINSVSDGDINRIEVTGSQIEFVQQPPATIAVNTNMSPIPTVILKDQNGSIDLDFNDTVFIESTSTNQPIDFLPTLFTTGEYAFDNIVHTALETNVRLIVNGQNITPPVYSNYFAVNMGELVGAFFDPIGPICSGSALVLPTTSTNGVTGSWSPAANNTQTTSYLFTPDSGQDSEIAYMTVIVNSNVEPSFNPVPPINIGGNLSALPTISTNGITGSWSPALDNTQTTTYTFTPTAGLCALTTTLTIVVYDNSVIVPIFNPVSPICIDGNIAALPTTSTNGIGGSWSPALDSTVTTTYTFTPDPGQSAVNTVLTVTVNPLTEPTFTPVAPAAFGATINPNVLPSTSLNGIPGTWSPALNNTATTTYVFTPTSSLCATTTTLTIEIESPTQVEVEPLEEYTVTNPDGSTTVVEYPLRVTDTKGELSVSGSGTPNYRIPIALPPGIKDVAPQLALEYSGASVHGVAGMGWNLNGISSVMRVSSRLDLDGVIDAVDFDELDRFALDGQRLIPVSGTYGAPGTVYQTENYSNLKVETEGPFGTSVGLSTYGPKSFIVTFPDGSQAFYGQTADSKALSEWKINKWIDPQGNYITYEYFTENHVTQITKIRWGRNQNSQQGVQNSIEFRYGQRGRLEYSYIQGTEIASKYVLRRITVKSEGEVFRAYTIGHESRSGYPRVKYVIESAGDNTVSNPVYFTYNDTNGNFGEFTQTQSVTGGSQVDNIDVSGDFDGDGKVDFVASNKLYLSPIDNNNNWYGVEFVSADKYIPVLVVESSALNQFQSILAVDEKYNMNSYRLYSYNRFTNEMDQKSFVNAFYNDFTTCSTGGAYTPCEFTPPADKSSSFLEGDYNGDGITEVIHVRPIVKRLKPHAFADYVYNVDGYKAYFVNVNENSVSENNNLHPLYGKANFCADFNGDGRTDILAVDKETSNYTVYQYSIPTNQLQVIFSGNFSEDIMAGGNLKQIVFGDFNGDAKTDILIPKALGSKTWILRLSTGASFKYDVYNNFAFYQPHWQGPPSANRTIVRTYRAADLNKDGKSDFVVHEWESWNSFLTINDRNSKGYIRYKENLGDSVNSKPTFATNVVRTVYSGYGDPIHCLLGEFKNHQANFEFTLVQRGTLWKGQYEKDINEESALTKVEEVKRKVSVELSYKPLIRGSVNDVYDSSGTGLYPFTPLRNVPSMKVVDKITVYDGETPLKHQLFKYGGLTVHQTGLGVLGFQKMARSSWFNDANPEKIWSCYQTSPQLLGQKIAEWSYSGENHSNFIGPPIFTPGPDLIGSTFNTYTSSVLGNGVRIIVPNKVVKKDYLTDLTSQTEYFYDNYWNVERTVFTNDVGTKETVNAFYNNPTGAGKLYAIGRLTQVNETISNYGDTFTTEQKFNYHPTLTNLVQQSQKKGHNTDYVTEDYEYDVFGNVVKKSVSAPNVTTRVTLDKYDEKGKFVIEKTNPEGLVSKFEYNRLGQVTKSIDPFGVVTITNYNNWGLLTGITVTGASTGTRKSTLSYSRDSNGSLITTNTNTETNEVVRTFVNRLGQNIKSTTKGFASNTWISKDIEYDFLGRKSRESEPYLDSNPTSTNGGGNKWNYIRYDYLSRPYEQESYNGRVQTIVYDGLTTTTTDGPKTIEVTYDANGKKRVVTDNGETLNFNYYASGLQKETVYGNHTITYNYDGWGRNIYMLDPSVSSTPYTNTYNNFGELLTATTPTGTTTITYSPTGRITEKTAVGQNTDIESTFVYSPKGLLLSETGTANGKTFSYVNTYNSLSQLISKKETTQDNYTHTQTFTYDSQGRALQEQTNSFLTNNPDVNNGNITIEYGYNAYNGMLEQYKNVADNNILWKLNSANEKMQVLTAVLGNGIEITNGYDNDYYIETIEHADATNTALNLEYDFVRDRGTLNWRKNNIAGVYSWNETFTYDSFERLLTWTDPTGTSSNSYENDGRINQNDKVGTYNYGGGSRYKRTSADLNTAGEDHYLDRTLQNITYNMFKSPVSITELTRGSVNFEYNLSSTRSKSVTLAEDGETIVKTKYYSGISDVEVIEKPNQTLQFITYLAGSPYSAVVALEKTYTASGGSYAPESQEFLYLHRDFQGTILAISGDGGAIKERRIFDPWGNLKKKYIGNTAVADANLGLVDFELLTDRGYTGHEHFFSVGIIHMNARIYDPVLRSFLSCDALISNPDNSQNYNRYAYALNNPLMYVDYDGNEAVTAITITTAIIIGAAIGATVYIGTAFYTGTFSWGGFAKSIIIGAASGAASFGIGELISTLSTSVCTAAPTLTKLKIDLMLMLPQATMHGVAQGFIQGVSGGNGSQSFLTAAISSIAGGGYGMAGGSFSQSGAGQVLFGTFAGGATASLTGGNFWEGAVTGMVVSWLNHVAHRPGSEEDDNGYDKNGKKVNDKGGNTIDYRYDDNGNIIDSTPVQYRGISQGEYIELGGTRGYGVDGWKMSTGATNADNTLFEIFAGTKIFNAITGGIKQWIRIGPSFSKSGDFKTVSIKWGAGGKKHVEKIGSPRLQNVNKSLRQTKLPGNSWRVKDPGHLHLWKRSK